MRAFMYDPAAASDDGDDFTDVIDLIPYVFPVRRLVGWYERLVDLDAPEPDIFELDEIVIAIQALPPLSGQLGRDIALIAHAPDETFRADIIDAIGRLRRLATLEILDDRAPKAG